MPARPPWKDIPDTNLVPAGAYEFAVKELAEVMSKATETTKAKLMYVAQLKITEPKGYKNLVLFDRFTVGTEDDPEAKDPETWKGSIAARRLKSFVKALNVPLGDDMDDTMEAVEAQKGIAMVTLEGKRLDPKSGRTFNESNAISAYYALGTPNVTIGTAAPAAPAPAAPAPKAKKAMPPADEPEVVTAPAKTKGKAKGEVTTCPICGDDNVPRLGFIAHVAQHSGEDEEVET